jgi:hypothetical protein
VTGVQTCALPIFDVGSITRIDAAAQQFQAAGANIRGIGSEGRIDPAACDALSMTISIAASGALSTGEPVFLGAAPWTQVLTYRTTPGFGALLGIHPEATGGVWVETGLASALGVQVGTTLPTNHGDMTVTALYDWPNDGRDARLSYAVLIPEPPVALLDECWMRSWPVMRENDDLLRSVAIVIPGRQVSVQVVQLNKNLGAVYDAHEEFTTRVTAEVHWLAMLAGFALGVVAVIRRRIEYASAFHAGQDRSNHLLTVVLETIVWAGAGTALGSMACLVAAQISGVSDWYSTWLVVVRAPLLAGVGSLCGTLLGSSFIKERLLFRYFRQR